MGQKQRLEEIRQKVRQERRVVVSELSVLFGVTEETIRRDLDKLEAEGVVARTYGGAVLNGEASMERIEFNRRAAICVEEKQYIAKLCAMELPLNGTIATDASTTVLEALRAISDRPGITVLTPSIRAVSDFLDTEVCIISTGGIVNKSTYAFEGLIPQKLMAAYHTDYTLLSCKALNLESGIFDSVEEEVLLKRTIISQGQKVILLADHTKFDRLAFVKLADFADLDVIITDRKPSDAWCIEMEKRNIRLVY